MKDLEKMFERVLAESTIFEETTPDKKNDSSKAPSSSSRPLTANEAISAYRALGSGAFKTKIGSRRSRAFSDPDGLIRDLGISKPSDLTPIDQAMNIMKQAVRNKDMSVFFGAPVKSRKKVAEAGEQGLVGKEIDVVYVPVLHDNVLGYRDGVYYVRDTLIAAFNSGIFKPTKKIRFIPEGGGLRHPTFYAID